jgi:hypothetical protein
LTVADLDLIHHPASIQGDWIHVRNLCFTAEEFTLAGLLLVDYSEEEERELVRLGVLACRS